MAREFVKPDEIEARSFAIIREELGAACPADPALAAILVRIIHTTADFSFAENLCLSPGAIAAALTAIRRGAVIITDTMMAKAGVDKTRLARFGGEVCCYIAEPAVAEAAKRDGTTRAQAAVDFAAAKHRAEGRPLIFATGNAPTALFRIAELAAAGEIAPALVIGVPVGFVNVVESKEALFAGALPYIAVRGRKGGSTVAATVCNALLRLAEAESKAE